MTEETAHTQDGDAEGTPQGATAAQDTPEGDTPTTSADAGAEGSPEAAQDAHDGDGEGEGDDAEGDDEGDDTPTRRARREAARYRTRARDAESQLQEVQGQLDAVRRQEAERQVGDRLPRPSALWAVGYQPKDLAADDGAIDTERLDAAISHVFEQTGLKPPSTYVHDSGRNPRPEPKSDMVNAILGNTG